MNEQAYLFDAAIASAVPAIDAPTLDAKPSSSRTTPLSAGLLDRMHRYWMAANYLTVGQIFLQDNPLLREPLRAEHIKPRLLGHWGTSPGLNLIYVHLNRMIAERDANVIYLAGPGHGGPAIVANVYLEGTYSEIYPDITRDVAGLRALVPSVLDAGRHPESRQCADARLDSRRRRARLRAGARVRRGVRQSRSRSSPRSSATAKRRPRRSRDRGRVRASSTRRATARCFRFCISTATRSAGRRCSAAQTDADVRHRCSKAHGYDVARRRGRRSDARCTRRSPATLDACYRPHSRRFRRARATAQRTSPSGRAGRRSCCARRKDGPDRRSSTAFRSKARSASHQVPLPHVAHESATSSRMLEQWLRSYQPETLFDASGALVPRARGARADGRPAHGRQPARQWRPRAASTRPSRLPRVRASTFRSPATVRARIHAAARRDAARRVRPQRATRATSASSAPTRRTRIGCRACSRSRIAVSSADASPIDDHVAPTAA